MQTAFFEFLDNRRITNDSMEGVLGAFDADELAAFVAEAREMVVTEGDATPSPYAFLANSQLSGAPFPCGAPRCRIGHAENTARFAALYADHVAIQDPFYFIERVASTNLEWDRWMVEGSLRVLTSLRPLIERGMVSIVAPAHHFCEQHIPDIVKSGLLDQADKALTTRFTSELTFTLQRGGDAASIVVDGPPSLVDHPMVYMPVGEMRDRIAKSLRSRNPRVDAATRKSILAGMVNRVVDDILQQDIFSRGHDLRYLTDREVDFDALRAVTSPDLDTLSRAVSEGLTHSLPTLKQLSISQLLKLRDSEGEAFTVYRDAVAKVLREIGPSDARRVRQAFNDVILPELNRIDSVVKNAQRRLRRSAMSDLLLGAGVVSVGLFSGFLTPDVGKLLAGLGGTNFGVKALQRLNELGREPDSISDSSFYFLWRAREAATS
jgi:hypothetical protein